MSLPDAPRVAYELNTLSEVVCTLNFPPILRIEAETPSAFQDLVRRDYPNYNLKIDSQLPREIPPQIARMISSDLGVTENRTHWFGSDRGGWIGLTRDAFFYQDRNYDSWEVFRDRLAKALHAFITIYAPAYFDHVCLKYRNSVRRSLLPDPAAPWSHWLRPWASGPLGWDEVAADTERLQTKITLRLPGESGRLDSTYGLARDAKTGETYFAIDTHTFTDRRTEPSDALDRLDALHGHAWLFFRSAISDRLHEALRPSGRALAGQ